MHALIGIILYSILNASDDVWFSHSTNLLGEKTAAGPPPIKATYLDEDNTDAKLTEPSRSAEVSDYLREKT